MNPQHLHTNQDIPQTNKRTYSALSELFAALNNALNQNNYFAALALCEEALEDLSDTSNDFRGRVLVRMGDLYADLADYPNALNYYQQALDVFEEAGDFETSAVTQHLIGVLYGNSGDYNSAFDYLNRALHLFREIGASLMEVSTVRNIGAICLARGDLDNALEYELRALTVYDALEDNMNAAAAMITIGDIQERKGEPEVALSFYLRASEALEKSTATTPAARSDTDDTDRLLTAAMLGLGRVYYKTGDVQSARFALEQGLALATEGKNRQQIWHFHFELSRVLESLGDYRGALEYARKHATIREEFVNEERNRSMAELQMRFDLERALKEEELRRQHDVTTAVLETQEVERRRIARELHDGIGQLLAAVRVNLLRLQESSFRKTEKAAYDRSIELVGKAATDVRAISHSLGSSTLHELGIVAALREVVADMNASEQIDFSFEISGPRKGIPDPIGLGLFRVAQELIANVVRHSQATEATVQFFRRDGFVTLMVEDNGVGFDTATQVRGMGTRNIEARVHAMNGTVRFDSVPEHGTTVTVEAPL